MQKKGAPTIHDVARKAGVNRVTASVVLNNARANTRVSEATRQRILTVAAELRYQPNAVAQSLRRRRTNIIGFYSGSNYTDLRNPFVSQLVSGIQKGCEQFEKDLLVQRQYPGRSAEAIYAELANGKVDGLVLYVAPEDPLLDYFVDSHLPVIVVADSNPRLPSVVVDDADGGRIQALHLAERGHRHLFYQCGASLTSVRRRLTAFCETAAERGMRVTLGEPTGQHDVALNAASRALIASKAGDRPTAAVGWEDLCAHRMLRECEAMGLRVPQDLAIVGFDGIEPLIEPIRRITSIRAPWREVARTAVSLLVSQLEGNDVPMETVLPVELVVGNTT